MDEQSYNSSFTGEQIDTAVLSVRENASSWDKKQEKITGTSNQIIGFDDAGDAIPLDEISEIDLLKIWNA